jgi:lipid-binding SYLF domain-containing protein
MKYLAKVAMAVVALALVGGSALAATDAETVALFKKAGESSKYFGKSYGYAVFPTVGKGGIGVGGAFGKGSVYQGGKYMGDVTLTQVSVGFQLGGEGFSEIIFLQDKRAYDEFTSGQFEFDAGASVTAITANASASAGTQGATSQAGTSKKDTQNDSAGYHKGMVIFTITKGGLMYEAVVAGQKFKYTPGGKK